MQSIANRLICMAYIVCRLLCLLGALRAHPSNVVHELRSGHRLQPLVASHTFAADHNTILRSLLVAYIAIVGLRSS